MFLFVIWLISPLFFIPMFFYKNSEVKKIKGNIKRANMSITNRAMELLRQGKISEKSYNHIAFGTSESSANVAEDTPATATLPNGMTYHPVQSTVKPQWTVKNAQSDIVPTPVQPKPVQSFVYQPSQPANLIAKKPLSNIKQATAESASISQESYVFGNMSYQPNPKTKISTINLLAIMGAVFVVLSGAVFVASQWSDMTNLVKIIIMLSACGLFFAFSEFVERKLKIKNTGLAMFAIATALLPITFIGIGFLGLLGDSLSLPNGEHGFLMLTMSNLVLAAGSAVGVKKYHSKIYGYIAMFSVSLSTLFVMLDADISRGVFNLLTGLNIVVAVILGELISRKSRSVYGEIAIQFAVCNTLFMSLFTLFTSENSILSAITMFAVAAVYLNRRYVNAKNQISLIPFAVFLLVGLYRIFQPTDLSQGSLWLATAVLTVSVLSELKMFSEPVVKAFRVLLTAISVFTFIVCTISYGEIVRFNSFESLVSLAIIILSISWTFFKTKSKVLAGYHNLLVLMFIFSLSRYIFSGENSFSGMCLFASVALSIAWAAYYYTKKMHTPITDIAYSICSFICIACLIAANSDVSSFAIIFTALLLVAMTTIIAFEKSERILPKVYSFLQIGSIYTLFAAIDQVIYNEIKELYFDEIALSFFATISLIGIVLSLASRKSSSYKFNLLAYDLVVVTVGMCASSIGEKYDLAFCWGVVIYTLAQLVVVGKTAANVKRNVFSFIAVTFSLIATFDSVIEISALENNEDTAYIMTAIVCALELLAVAYLSRIKGFAGSKQLGSFKLPVMIHTTLVPLIMCSHAQLETPLFWVTFIMLAVSFTSQYTLKINIGCIAPMFALFALLDNLLVDYQLEDGAYIAIMLTVEIALLAIGRILHQEFASDSKVANVDMLSVSSLLCSFYILAYTASMSVFFISLAIFFAGLLHKRFHGKNADKTLLTLISTSLSLAWIYQTIFDYPEIISLELNLLPILVLAAVIKVIWSNKNEAADVISFAMSVICTMTLMINAFVTTLIDDTLMLMMISFIMIFISLCIKRKKWLLFSLGMIIFTTIYMMSRFVHLFSWWVYLLIAGVILIAIAAFKEYSRQHEQNAISSLKQKATDLYHEWDW